MSQELTQLRKLGSYYANRRIGARIGFGTRPVLLIIDMSRAFTSADYSVGSNADSVIGHIRQLLQLVRRRPIPVIYTTVSYADPSQAGLWGAKIPGLLDLKADDPNATQIHPEIAPSLGELVINKHYSSAFFGTDLDKQLHHLNIDTVLLTGCSTSGCVRATAVDAVSSGYRVIVPREAVGDRAQLPHEAALFDIDSKYGDVMGISEVHEYLRHIPTECTNAEGTIQ